MGNATFFSCHPILLIVPYNKTELKMRPVYNTDRTVATVAYYRLTRVYTRVTVLPHLIKSGLTANRNCLFLHFTYSLISLIFEVTVMNTN